MLSTNENEAEWARLERALLGRHHLDTHLRVIFVTKFVTSQVGDVVMHDYKERVVTICLDHLK